MPQGTPRVGSSPSSDLSNPKQRRLLHQDLDEFAKCGATSSPLHFESSAQRRWISFSPPFHPVPPFSFLRRTWKCTSALDLSSASQFPLRACGGHGALICGGRRLLYPHQINSKRKGEGKKPGGGCSLTSGTYRIAHVIEFVTLIMELAEAHC